MDIANLAICVAGKGVNEYCFYWEVSLKSVVHLRMLGKVLKMCYMTLICFNGRTKFEKYLIIMRKIDKTNLAIFITAKSVN